jgi:hypothetical protein
MFPPENVLPEEQVPVKYTVIPAVLVISNLELSLKTTYYINFCEFSVFCIAIALLHPRISRKVK